MNAVSDALRRSPLLAPHDRVLVACSGGPDSLALLHALHELREELHITVAAAHLHHGLRGADADADARFVETFCAARGIPCTVGHADIPALARARKQSTETAARDARYAFLDETAARVGAAKIATGHTADDQAETVLLHLLRGAGLDGLRGIPAQRDKIIRPLLEVSRADVEHYCAEHALTPCQDATNRDVQNSTRSRVRHELLPALEQDYNPAVRDALLRLSHTAGRDADFLHAEANKALAECVTRHDSNSLTLDADALYHLHPALLRRTLRAAIADVRGTMEGITFDHVEALCAAVEARGQKGLTLPAPVLCRVRVTQMQVIVFLPPAPPMLNDAVFLLPVPGETLFGAWTVRADVVPVPPERPCDLFTALLDADSVDAPSLVVRRVRAGDRIAPPGMQGHTQKVNSIFANAKVPCGERPFMPIIADRDGLLWVVGHAVAERARLQPGTRRVLRLHARRG